MAQTIDKTFLWTILLLSLLGFFIFSSASLGLVTREGVTPLSLIASQAVSLGLGLVLLFVFSRIPYQFWNKFSLYVLFGAILLTLLVFIPGLGFSHGGAQRWIDLGFMTFQPSEVLKVAFVIYFAAWLAGARRKLHKMKFSIVPLLTLLALIGGILAIQPDLDTFFITAATGGFMLIAAGGRWRHVAILVVSGLVGLLAIGIIFPYAQERLLTFVNPDRDPLGAGYQIQQSLIAVGSGGLFGRGFGQSVQKFSYLPEPVGDSIFAVFAEEWGFVGTVILLALFSFFALRGYRIAARAPSLFSGLLVVGIISMVILQSLLNISAMLGIAPLSGLPLLFISQGGSALLVTLAATGIVLNVSRHMKSA